MDLFICATAYQLLNALIITIQEKATADLIITHRNMDKICDVDEIKRSGVFRNVYCWYELTDAVTNGGIKSQADGFSGKLKKLTAYLRKTAVYRSLPNKEKRYTRVFLGYDEIPAEYICWWFEKKGAAIHLYDDGTYTYKCFEISPTIPKRLISWMLFRNQLLNKCNDIWVRSIDSVSTGKRKDVSIHKIQPDNAEIRKLAGAFFKGSFEPDQFDAPIIFLDQYFSDEKCDSLQKQTVALLNKVFGSNALIVKLHPSTDSDKYETGVRVTKTKIPFELFISSIDIDNKILIAIYSTACFTPKLVFDKEPMVLFLYKLAGLNDEGTIINQKYYDEIEEFKQRYEHKDRVIDIDNMQELVEVINNKLNRGDY